MMRKQFTSFLYIFSTLIISTSCTLHTKPVSDKQGTAGELKKERSPQDINLLMSVINSRDLNALGRMLSAGADPNTQDAAGYSPLMVASLRGEKEMVELLLQAGAHIDGTGSLDRTPLMVAVEAGQTQVVELLVEKGANIELKGPPPLDETALHVAARRITDKGIMGALLSRSPNVNIKNAEGNTALMIAVNYNPEALRALIDKGADVNAANNQGRTALMISIGSLEIMNLLLTHGADVNVRDGDGWTALEIALLQGCPESIELLEKAGAQE